MKLNLKVTDELLLGAKRLAPALGIEICEDGITVEAICGERTGVTLEGGEATVYYKNTVQFYRGLGLLVEKAKDATAFFFSL